MLAGLPTRIFQTVHNGVLAFLVVISRNEKTSKSSESSVFTRRRSPVRIRQSPSFFYQSATLEPSIEAFSLARIMTRNKHNKDKKLHNSDEKLHNSHEPDLTWQEMTDLSPRPARSSDGMGLYSTLTEYQPGLSSLATSFAYPDSYFSPLTSLPL